MRHARAAIPIERLQMKRHSLAGKSFERRHVFWHKSAFICEKFKYIHIPIHQILLQRYKNNLIYTNINIIFDIFYPIACTFKKIAVSLQPNYVGMME